MNQYTVKPGDSLSALASVLIGPGASYHELWSHNPQIADPNRIEIGDVIYYPGTGGSIVTTPPRVTTQTAAKTGLLDQATKFLTSTTGMITAAVTVIGGALLVKTLMKEKSASMSGPFVVQSNPKKKSKKSKWVPISSKEGKASAQKLQDMMMYQMMASEFMGAKGIKKLRKADEKLIKSFLEKQIGRKLKI